MNETPLLDQIRVYSEALVEDLPNPATNVVKAPEPLAPLPAQRNLGWLVAMAAAALIVILVGAAAWLSPLSGTAVPPSGEPAETTIPVATTAPEAEGVTETTVTATTEATVPVPPPGEGPKLEFVQTDAPRLFQDGVWFKGALYAISRGDELSRTVDGVTWDLLPGFPAGDGRELKTDGVRLVSAASAVPAIGSGCAGSDAFFEVNTSTNGVDWTSSKIPLPVAEEASVAGCFQADVGEMATGPQGIIVTGRLALVVGGGFGSNLIDPDDGIHVETTVDLDRGVIIAEFFNEPDMEPTGEIVEISLDDAGFTELFSYMEADPGWEPLIEPLLQSISKDPEGSVSRGLAWFSPDGKTWQALDAAGPLDGANGAGISEIEATPDGFIATSGSRLWETTDGTAWTEGTLLPERDFWRLGPLAVWAGTPISFSNQGVWTIEATPQELLPGIVRNDMDYWVGDFGLVGLVPEKGGGATADEILFSEDGTTWNRWNPPELDPEAGYLHMVGIADDFVVLQQGHLDTAVLWIGTLP